MSEEKLLKTALHEILAVDKDSRDVVKKIIDEGSATFKTRTDHFDGHYRTYEPNSPEDMERFPEETKEIVETIRGKLDYIEDTVVKHIDILLQKEEANQRAVADITIRRDDGSTLTIAKDVPASMLLQLETLLGRMRNDIYRVIPTLKPGPNWQLDEAKGKGIYRHDEGKRPRTRKTYKSHVLHEGNDKHPPQAQLVTVEEPVGMWNQQNFSARVTPAWKSDQLARVETLLRAVKTARARANETKVKEIRIGREIMRFVRGEIQ